MKDNQQNATLAFEDYNFIAVGDWYCNEETEKTVQNILSIEPEVIITTGDQIKESPSFSCRIEISKPIKDIMRIAIGNYDAAEFANIYKQIVDYHNIKSPYYSDDFKNVHFISISTKHHYEAGSKQYEFNKNGLEKTSTNSIIDWIIVRHYKSFYSIHIDREDAEQLRDIFLPVFKKYDVDLVIASHNQYYERTYPVLYNKDFEKDTNKKVESQPIITEYNELEYPPTNGIVFLIVGTAGDKLDPVKERHGYYVIHESEFNIENNDKTIVREFHTNEGNIIDHFELNEA